MFTRTSPGESYIQEKKRLMDGVRACKHRSSRHSLLHEVETLRFAEPELIDGEVARSGKNDNKGGWWGQGDDENGSRRSE